jgi:Activator of Hsp90 ATPase homolog 1-like protein
MIEPLSLSFVVSCPAEAAFHLWTDRTTLWWPAEHTATGAAGSTVTFEPFAGGRVYERTAAGEEIDWGEVVVWEPPVRLTYLWHIRADRADATEVEISFAAEDEHRCRVDIEHRAWERLGARGQDRRDANRRGWDGLLPHYVAACDARGRDARVLE